MTETYVIDRTGYRKGRGGYTVTVNPDHCIIWDGNLNTKGYGRLWVLDSRHDKTVQRYTHRMAWEFFYSPIPEGWEVDHLCANPACMAIEHLEAVSPEENRRRMNARVSHCPKGHEYTEKNTAYNNGWRYCRECHRTRERLRKRRLKAEND